MDYLIGISHPNDDSLIYEPDENGELQVVRSEMSIDRAHIRFYNKTTRPVDVWWRDYDGVKRFYVRMRPAGIYDIDSYVTHPWEFSDSDTKEPYVINNKTVFRPPANVGGTPYRRIWNVTVRVRSLRQTALLAVARRLPEPESVDELDLPVCILRDLICMYALLNPRKKKSL